MARSARVRRLTSAARRAADDVFLSPTYDNACEAEAAFGDLADALIIEERLYGSPPPPPFVPDPQRATPRPRRLTAPPGEAKVSP